MSEFDSIVIVVFGASGDLAKKKTFPALYTLYKDGHLCPNVRIFGFARSDFSQEEFEHNSLKNISDDKEAEKVKEFYNICEYYSGKYDKDSSYQHLDAKITPFEGSCKNKQRLFYLATPPSQYKNISSMISKNCYLRDGYNRLVIEKPFGKDTKSSEELGNYITEYWKEEEIYRIDHYLGKEMLKNILIFRFANTIFEAFWNRKFVDNVRITFKEPFGTEGRGGYFDEFGMIRDVAQNHLIQLMCLVAMEKPKSKNSEDIRNEKVQLLKSIKPIERDNVLIAQYDKNEEKQKPAYTDDEGMDKNSNTPTFAVLKMDIDNDRWKGVPFIMKCGKALDEHKVEVRIQFKEVQDSIFLNLSRNELVIRLQPKQAIYIKYMNKKPGFTMKSAITEMDLTYENRFPGVRVPEAYEALILEALKGNVSNFVRSDELHLAWEIFTPILHLIDNKEIKCLKYKYGTRGPNEADEFIKKFGFQQDKGPYDWTKIKDKM